MGASKPKQPPLDTAAESLRGCSTIPYVIGTSEPLKRVLENHGIKAAFKPYQAISQIFPKPKDQMDKEETRDPVYDIPCADCSKSYIGETQRKFITRKGEHQKAVARRQGEKSALADHVIKIRQITISHEMRPQVSGLMITGTKERFSEPGRLIAPKTDSTGTTGRYPPGSIYI